MQSQQQISFSVGSGNAGGNDVIEREYYEYNPPGTGGHRQRQGSPFGGILPGFIIVIASSALQWYNEGRAVRDAKMLAKAASQVVELDSHAPFDEKNDGKLVHISGNIATDGGLTDLEHGLRRPDALQLTRTTEAYQWKEHKTENRRRVSNRETKVHVYYRYNKMWSQRRIESNRFKSPNHYNPPTKYYLGRSVMTVNDARVSNGLRVPPDLVNQLSSNSFMHTGSIYPENNHVISAVNLLSADNLQTNNDAVILLNENKLYISGTKSPSDLLSLGYSQPGIVTSSNVPAIRSSPNPEIGDIKVSWSEVTAPIHGVSILAKQESGYLVPWSQSNGHMIYNLLPGKFSAKTMISQLISRSKFTTKLLRIGGWIGSFIGFNLVLSCIPALIKLLPFGVGHILEPLVSIATSTIAFGVSTGLSLSVISVAWLRFRPLFAACLAIISSAGFLGPLYYAKWKRSAEVTEIDGILKSNEL